MVHERKSSQILITGQIPRLAILSAVHIHVRRARHLLVVKHTVVVDICWRPGPHRAASS